jgi:hypothetical protein
MDSHNRLTFSIIPIPYRFQVPLFKPSMKPLTPSIGLLTAVGLPEDERRERRPAAHCSALVAGWLLGSAAPAFALHSVAPPAPFYSKTAQLRQDVHFTRRLDPGSAVASPRWLDDFTTYSDVRLRAASSLCLGYLFSLHAAANAGAWIFRQATCVHDEQHAAHTS